MVGLNESKHVLGASGSFLPHEILQRILFSKRSIFPIYLSFFRYVSSTQG